MCGGLVCRGEPSPPTNESHTRITKGMEFDSVLVGTGRTVKEGKRVTVTWVLPQDSWFTPFFVFGCALWWHNQIPPAREGQGLIPPQNFGLQGGSQGVAVGPGVGITGFPLHRDCGFGQEPRTPKGGRRVFPLWGSHPVDPKEIRITRGTLDGRVGKRLAHPASNLSPQFFCPDFAPPPRRK